MEGKPDRKLASWRGDAATCGWGPRSWHHRAMRAVGIWNASSRCISQVVVLAWQGQGEAPELEGRRLWMVVPGPQASGMR